MDKMVFVGGITALALAVVFNVNVVVGQITAGTEYCKPDYVLEDNELCPRSMCAWYSAYVRGILSKVKWPVDNGVVTNGVSNIGNKFQTKGSNPYLYVPQFLNSGRPYDNLKPPARETFTIEFLFRIDNPKNGRAYRVFGNINDPRGSTADCADKTLTVDVTYTGAEYLVDLMAVGAKDRSDNSRNPINISNSISMSRGNYMRLVVSLSGGVMSATAFDMGADGSQVINWQSLGSDAMGRLIESSCGLGVFNNILGSVIYFRLFEFCTIE